VPVALVASCERLSAKPELWNPAKGHTDWSEATYLTRRLRRQLSCSAAPQTGESNGRTGEESHLRSSSSERQVGPEA
jgi:hypothetical protein